MHSGIRGIHFFRTIYRQQYDFIFFFLKQQMFKIGIFHLIITPLIDSQNSVFAADFSLGELNAPAVKVIFGLCVAAPVKS